MFHASVVKPTTICLFVDGALLTSSNVAMHIFESRNLSLFTTGLSANDWTYTQQHPKIRRRYRWDIRDIWYVSISFTPIVAIWMISKVIRSSCFHAYQAVVFFTTLCNSWRRFRCYWLITVRYLDTSNVNLIFDRNYTNTNPCAIPYGRSNNTAHIRKIKNGVFGVVFELQKWTSIIEFWRLSKTECNFSGFERGTRKKKKFVLVFDVPIGTT